MENYQLLTFHDSLIMACMECGFTVTGRNPPEGAALLTQDARKRGIDHANARGHKVDYIFRLEGRCFPRA